MTQSELDRRADRLSISPDVLLMMLHLKQANEWAASASGKAHKLGQLETDAVYPAEKSSRDALSALCNRYHVQPCQLEGDE